MMSKSAFFRSALTALAVFSTNSAEARESASTLHIPWPLIEAELKSTIDNGAAPWRSTLPDTAIVVSGWTWNLSGLRVDAQVTADAPVVTGSQLFLRASKLSARLGVDRISVDQIIEREVSGALVRIHLQASCGPIRLIQEQAQAEATLAMDWSSGSPVAHLANLGLAWSPGTWVVSEFSCEGPRGFGDLLRDEILKRTKEPSEIKPLLADWLGKELQVRLQDSLQKMKSPLSMGTGDGQLPLRVGTMSPASTGLLVNLLLGEASPVPPTGSLPSNNLLASLPKDAPVLLGSLDVLDVLVQNELKSQGEIVTIDARTISSLKTLLNSRFLQFFMWPDLFNYAKNSPFYLRLKIPQDVHLTTGEEGLLSATLPIQAVLQSKRDGAWWDYVTAQGKADATIDLRVSAGQLSIQTSLDNPRVSIGFGKEYKKAYGSTGWLPTSSIRQGLQGPQSALSGTRTLPDVDLGSAGRYRASQFDWADAQTFAITWQKAP